MTLKYIKVAEDLMAGKTHPLPCMCAACLYPRHLVWLKHKRGRKYDKITFLVWWLIGKIKFSYLEKRGKTERIIADYINAPYLQELKRILKELPESKESEWFYLGLENYVNKYAYLKSYLKKGRYHQSRLLKLWGELESEISAKWRKKQPEPSPRQKREWKGAWEDLKNIDENRKFAQRVARFIRSQNREEIPRHLLLRRFNNKREADLERVHDILESDYRIYFNPKIYRGKSTGYYSVYK